MKQIKVGGSELKTSAIAIGCMRISEMTVNDVSRLIKIQMRDRERVL